MNPQYLARLKYITSWASQQPCTCRPDGPIFRRKKCVPCFAKDTFPLEHGMSIEDLGDDLAHGLVKITAHTERNVPTGVMEVSHFQGTAERSEPKVEKLPDVFPNGALMESLSKTLLEEKALATYRELQRDPLVFVKQSMSLTPHRPICATMGCEFVVTAEASVFCDLCQADVLRHEQEKKHLIGFDCRECGATTPMAYHYPNCPHSSEEPREE